MKRELIAGPTNVASSTQFRQDLKNYQRYNNVPISRRVDFLTLSTNTRQVKTRDARVCQSHDERSKPWIQTNITNIEIETWLSWDLKLISQLIEINCLNNNTLLAPHFESRWRAGDYPDNSMLRSDDIEKSRNPRQVVRSIRVPVRGWAILRTLEFKVIPSPG